MRLELQLRDEDSYCDKTPTWTNQEPTYLSLDDQS